MAETIASQFTIDWYKWKKPEPIKNQKKPKKYFLWSLKLLYTLKNSLKVSDQ